MAGPPGSMVLTIFMSAGKPPADAPMAMSSHSSRADTRRFRLEVTTLPLRAAILVLRNKKPERKGYQPIIAARHPGDAFVSARLVHAPPRSAVCSSRRLFLPTVLSPRTVADDPAGSFRKAGKSVAAGS